MVKFKKLKKQPQTYVYNTPFHTRTQFGMKLWHVLPVNNFKSNIYLKYAYIIISTLKTHP